MASNNSINNSLASPFNVGGTSVTSTGIQLNYLNGLTAVPINKINVQRFTSTGAFTYTKTAGTVYAIFELQGAGGGSGGTTGASSQGAVGSGGSAGGYQKILVSGANLDSVTGSVGAGGSAGTAGNNPGLVGGNTTLVVNSGSTWTSTGGGGGSGQAASALAKVSILSDVGSTTAGTNATLIIAMDGGTNGNGFVSATGAAPYSGSSGGQSFLSNGTNCLDTAIAGNLYGGGAGGAANNSGANLAGADGANGIVIVTEFISS